MKIDKQKVLDLINRYISDDIDKGYLTSAINALPASEDEARHIEIYRWLLGHDDFPARQEGQGMYYWRTPLREKLLEMGIDADRFFSASDKINLLPPPTK